MKKTYTATVNLTVDDIKTIIREHFNMPVDANVTFRVSDTSDEYCGTASYNLVGADVTSSVPAEIVFQQHRP